jgi:hypothetical protein
MMGVIARVEGLVVVGAAALFASACGGRIITAFPAGLEPLDAMNQAPDPMPVGDDMHPEKLAWAIGNTDQYAWVDARGFVHAPIDQVFQAIQTTTVCVDRRKVNRWSSTEGVESGYMVSFRIHDIVYGLATVDFDITWREDVVMGSREMPEAIAARYQKTDGTSYITTLAGSIVAQKVDDQTTEVAFIEHLSAWGSGTDTIHSYLVDLYSSILASVHGQPLPTY